MAGFEMVVKLRPCLVKGKRHLFHCWDHRAWPVGVCLNWTGGS